ncbi:MAG: PAS domain-containing protein, partial [Hyphomonadaceae bacterium]
PVLAAAHGMFGSVLSERMRRALRARQTESFEIEASEGRSVAVQVFPISEGVAALIQNTTEQERLKRQRAESDAFEAACCAHAALTRIKLDLNGRIAFIGDTFCKASGFTTDELIGHRFTDLVAALRRRAFANALEQAFRTLKPLHMPLTLIGKTGVEFSGDFAFAPAHIDFIARGGEAVWLASSPAAVAPTA